MSEPGCHRESSKGPRVSGVRDTFSEALPATESFRRGLLSHLLTAARRGKKLLLYRCPAALVTKSPSRKGPSSPVPSFYISVGNGERGNDLTPNEKDKIFIPGQSPGSQKQFLAVGLLQLLASSSRSLGRLTGAGREVPPPSRGAVLAIDSCWERGS